MKRFLFLAFAVPFLLSAQTLTDLLIERGKLQQQTMRLEESIRISLLDDRNTSDEIKALRKKIDEHAAEIARLQNEVNAKVRELPAVAEKIRTHQRNIVRLEELNRLIQAEEKKEGK